MKTVVQTIILTLLTIFGLTSCNNMTQTKTEKPTMTVDTTLKVTANQKVEQTTIMSDYMYYTNRSNFIAKLLIAGTPLYDHVVWENTEMEKWFGIFKNDTGFYIAGTKIKTSRVPDERYYHEDESDITSWAWLVQTVNLDTSIILIAGLDFLYNRKIQQADLSQKRIIPGDTLKFNYLGVAYKMFATGEKQEGDYSAYFGNHELYLTASKNGQIITEFFKAHEISNMQFIEFAGDIDGDGFLDLLISSSTFEDKCNRDLFTTLYLSKLADNGHLLKLVGCGEF